MGRPLQCRIAVKASCERGLAGFRFCFCFDIWAKYNLVSVPTNRSDELPMSGIDIGYDTGFNTLHQNMKTLPISYYCAIWQFGKGLPNSVGRDTFMWAGHPGLYNRERPIDSYARADGPWPINTGMSGEDAVRYPPFQPYDSRISSTASYSCMVSSPSSSSAASSRILNSWVRAARSACW